jgi:hypothetical protein
MVMEIRHFPANTCDKGQLLLGYEFNVDSASTTASRGQPNGKF